MKHLILSSILATAVSLSADEDKQKPAPSRSTETKSIRVKKPVTRNESTSTQTQIITKDGQTDGTVTVTINKDGQTEVKTWKIGGGKAASFQPRRLEVRRTGKMEKVTWLGIAITEVSEDLASQLPLPKGVRLRVRQVIDGSPAAKAGLRPDDLVSQLDQQLIFNVQQFQSLIRTYDAGEQIEITYYRKGRKNVTTAKLAQKEMLMAPADPVPNIKWRPDADAYWPNLHEQHRARAEAHRQQAIDAANKAREAAKMETWIRSSPAGKRAIIVRPDGKTTVVRTEEQIRSEIRKQVLQALKDAGVSEKVLKDTMKAFDQGLPNHLKN